MRSSARRLPADPAESAATAATAAEVGATERRTCRVGSARVLFGRNSGRASVRRTAEARGRCAGAGIAGSADVPTGESASNDRRRVGVVATGGIGESVVVDGPARGDAAGAPATGAAADGDAGTAGAESDPAPGSTTVGDVVGVACGAAAEGAGGTTSSAANGVAAGDGGAEVAPGPGVAVEVAAGELGRAAAGGGGVGSGDLRIWLATPGADAAAAVATPALVAAD